MKKIQRSGELLWVFGILFVAFGVAICNKADLGVSMIAAPAFILSETLSPIIPFFSVGVTEYIFQGVLLILLCIVIRRFNWRYLLAFGLAILYGYSLDLFLFLLRDVQLNYVWLRWVMLLVGDVIIAFGVACFFRTYMPLQVYELFVSELSKRFSFKLEKVKMAFDFSLLAISMLLAFVFFFGKDTLSLEAFTYSSFHNIGLGTLVTTAINSPLISFALKIVDRIFDPAPRFKRLESLLKLK